MLGDFLGSLRAVGRFLLGLLGAILPRRLWPAIDEYASASSAAAVSGLLTIALALLVGIPGFFDYAGTNADRATDITLQATGWREPRAGRRAPTEGDHLASWGATYLSVFTFVLLTPVGFASAYFTFSGLVRAVAPYAGDACGDPVLTLLDWACVTGVRRRRVTRARKARERAEGAEVPDRLITGAAGGFPEADWVVVASRQKAGWEPGVFVITSEKWYRLGTPVDRVTPAGLRTLYPLTELRTYEVLRRGVAYEFPRIS